MCYIEEVCLLSYYVTCCCIEIIDCCVSASIARQFHYNIRHQERALPPPAPKDSRNPFRNPNVPIDEHLQSAYG